MITQVFVHAHLAQPLGRAPWVELISDAALVVEEGRIRWVGKTDALPAEYRSLEAADLYGALLTPGFVDCHTHLVYGGCRADEFMRKCAGATYQEIAASGGGIHSSVRKTNAEGFDALYEAALKRLKWMVQGGTTSLEVKSGYGLCLDGERKMLQVARRLAVETGLTIKATFLGLHSVPPNVQRLDYVRMVCEEWLPTLRQEGLVDAVDAFIEQGYFTADDAETLAANAKTIPLRLHVDQFGDHGGAALGVRLGAKSVDHLEYTNADALRGLATTETFAVFLPASVHLIRSERYPDARTLIDAGGKFVLATDFNPGSSPSPSMVFTISLACLKMKMTPSECLAATTILPAQLLGISSQKGSLEPGKDADIAVWDVDQLEEIPYYVGAPLVKEVWLKGVRSSLQSP